MPKVIGTRESSPFHASLERQPTHAPEPHRACAYCKTRLARLALVCRNCGAPTTTEP